MAKKNPHFETVTSYEEALDLVTFEPVRPTYTAGCELQSVSVFVRDHKMRELPAGERSLEAYYGQFSFSQVKKGIAEARRWVVEVPYGRAPAQAKILGCEARVYELGPEVPPDDIDGRSPAVVVWYDREMFYLVASIQLESGELLRIATSTRPRPSV